MTIISHVSSSQQAHVLFILRSLFRLVQIFGQSFVNQLIWSPLYKMIDNDDGNTLSLVKGYSIAIMSLVLGLTDFEKESLLKQKFKTIPQNVFLIRYSFKMKTTIYKCLFLIEHMKMNSRPSCKVN